MEHNAVIKRNEVWLNATIWMNLGNITGNEIRQIQKDKYDSSYMRFLE